MRSTQETATMIASQCSKLLTGRLSICGLERSLKSHDVYRIPVRWVTGREKNGHVMDFREAEVGPKESRKESEVFLRGIPDSVAETVVSRFSFLVSRH